MIKILKILKIENTMDVCFDFQNLMFNRLHKTISFKSRLKNQILEFDYRALSLISKKKLFSKSKNSRLELFFR